MFPNIPKNRFTLWASHFKLQKETKLSDRYTRLKEEVKDLNKQIDQQVYKLYGLTEKEIKIVEKNENECI